MFDKMLIVHSFASITRMLIVIHGPGYLPALVLKLQVFHVQNAYKRLPPLGIVYFKKNGSVENFFLN